MASAIAIIPARYGSTRFPAKALACETGKPLVQHVWEQAGQAKSVERVVVATDDQRIFEAVTAFGGECVMTSTEHPNGSSRLNEACDSLGIADETIVVNVQGDEPELDPALIDASVEALEQTGAPVATIASPFAPGEDPGSPNIVKVVVDARGQALYFSRSLIPHPTEPGVAPLKHVGLYAYRRAYLREYVSAPAAPLERTERLEQLRVLETGNSIAVAVRTSHHHGVDTPEDYAAFVARWRAAAPMG